MTKEVCPKTYSNAKNGQKCVGAESPEMAQSTFLPHPMIEQTKEFLCSFPDLIFNADCTDKNGARLHRSPAILPKNKHTLEKSCFELVVFYSGEIY